MDVAVITQRQVGVSRTVEVPQIQFIAPFEDVYAMFYVLHVVDVSMVSGSLHC